MSFHVVLVTKYIVIVIIRQLLDIKLQANLDNIYCWRKGLKIVKCNADEKILCGRQADLAQQNEFRQQAIIAFCFSLVVDAKAFIFEGFCKAVSDYTVLFHINDKKRQ